MKGGRRRLAAMLLGSSSPSPSLSPIDNCEFPRGEEREGKEEEKRGNGKKSRKRMRIKPT